MIQTQNAVQLSDLDELQFQRSMSLPRGFGGQRPHPGVNNGPAPPPPRSDSMNALRNMMARRHRVRVSFPMVRIVRKHNKSILRINNSSDRSHSINNLIIHQTIHQDFHQIVQQTNHRIIDRIIRQIIHQIIHKIHQTNHSLYDSSIINQIFIN